MPFDELVIKIIGHPGLWQLGTAINKQTEKFCEPLLQNHLFWEVIKVSSANTHPIHYCKNKQINKRNLDISKTLGSKESYAANVYIIFN